MNDQLALTINIARSREERQRIFAFRYRIYVREMGKEDMKGVDHDREILCDDLDTKAMQFYAEVGGELAAVLRVNLGGISGIPEEFQETYNTDQFAKFSPSAFSFSSRLMVAAQQRGTSALHRLLNKAYETVMAKGVLFDFCNAAPALVELYQCLGYRRFTENFVDPAVGYRVPMILLVRDAQHLETIRSPFWRMLKKSPDLWQSDEVTVWLNEHFPSAQRATELSENEDIFWKFLGDRLNLETEKNIPLLEALNEAEQRKILQSGALLECRPGDAIIRAGDKGREMFVVISGVVEIKSSKTGHSIAVFGPGHIFGEIAFLADTTRTADVVALTDAEILAVSQTYLNKLRKSSPELAAKLLFNLSRVLCERLVCSNQTMSDRAEDGA